MAGAAASALDAAGITCGAIFRRVGRHDLLTDDGLTDKSLALIVKKHSEAAELKPDVLAGDSQRPRHGDPPHARKLGTKSFAEGEPKPGSVSGRRPTEAARAFFTDAVCA